MKNRLDEMWRIKEERKNQLNAKNQQGQVWTKLEKEDYMAAIKYKPVQSKRNRKNAGANGGNQIMETC